jgi:hypothetical protein
MPTSKHLELEVKFEAKDVNEDEFLKWSILRRPIKYVNSSCPDVYYINNNSDVVRHRWGSEAGTLTVKQRKSLKSITSRVEVDLEFAPGIEIPDITKFLESSGWKKTLTIYKDRVHVFWFEENDAIITLSLYSVKKLHEKTQKCSKPRHFMEAEIEKGSNITDEAAGVLLENWKNELTTTFSLDKPMNLSLFELFSGRTYKKVK